MKVGCVESWIVGSADEARAVLAVDRASANSARLFGRGGRADEHAVTSRLVDFFHDEFVEICQNVAEVLRDLGPECFDIGENRVLREVVADHLGDEGVDPLVVGDPGSDAVGERDVSGAIGVYESGNPEDAVVPESERIEEVIVDPAVNDVSSFSGRVWCASRCGSDRRSGPGLRRVRYPFSARGSCVRNTPS